MDSGNDDLRLTAELSAVPIICLRETSRRKLATFLDTEGSMVVVGEGNNATDVVNNFNGLAELAGFDFPTIRNLQRREYPTKTFLEQWNGHRATVGNLWRFLFDMERFDVLRACKPNIVRDCQLYIEKEEIERAAAMHDIVQDPAVTNSEMKVDETKFATKEDVETGQKTMYDAFICYTVEDEKDREFVRELISELEVHRGLKLFVPGRNDIPGSAQYTISAYLIEERCRRVVILMSRSFLQSQVCDFQVKFAHALAPGARSKRLIPIIREKGVMIPRILRFLAVCDFTKEDMLEWVWDRLYTAIIAPVGPVTYFEEEDPYNPFNCSLKDITFPSARRLDDEEERRLQARAAAGAQGAASRNREAAENSFYSQGDDFRGQSIQGQRERGPTENSKQSGSSRHVTSTRSVTRF